MKHARDYLRQPVPRRIPWRLYARRAVDVAAVIFMAAGLVWIVIFFLCI